MMPHHRRFHEKAGWKIGGLWLEKEKNRGSGEKKGRGKKFKARIIVVKLEKVRTSTHHESGG